MRYVGFPLCLRGRECLWAFGFGELGSDSNGSSVLAMSLRPLGTRKHSSSWTLYVLALSWEPANFRMWTKPSSLEDTRYGSRPLFFVSSRRKYTTSLISTSVCGLLIRLSALDRSLWLWLISRLWCCLVIRSISSKYICSLVNWSMW